MTRLVTLGFDDPHEVLLGSAQTEVNVKPARISSGGNSILGGLTSLGVLAINGNQIYWQYLIGSNKTDLYFAGSFYSPALTNGYLIVAFDTNSGVFGSTLNVIWNTNGSISIRRGSTVLATSAAGLITTNTKYTIECYVKPRNSAGEFTVKIDGTQVATSGSADTTDGNENCGGFRLYYPTNNNTLWMWWDDVALNDNAGAVNNTWVGRIFLYPLMLTGAGDASELTRGGRDMGSDFAQVRDADPFGVSFLQGDLDEYSLFTVDIPDLPAGATITNIIVQISGKSVSGAGEVAAIIKSGATEDQGDDQILTASAKVVQEVYAVDPSDSAAWTEADLADLQIGAVIRT